VVALNNAWGVVFPHPAEWFHASDFQDAGSLFPSETQWGCIKKRSVTQCQTEMYLHPKTCIALIDLLYMLLKRHKKTPTTNVTFVVVGSDMIYSNQGTHFYKDAGARDPLRLGQKWLQNELMHLYKTFNGSEVHLFNAGPKRPSLLPFPWFEDHFSFNTSKIDSNVTLDT